MPPASPRDYIAAYTHPLPAGTFNRTYTCDPRTAANSLFKVGCTYDAPDVPAGGANFTRRFELGPEAGELSVYEQFAPQDPSSSARLVSISGFTFVPGDQLLSSTGHDAIGILHAGRVATLRWNQDEVSLADVRSTRGAQVVTLVFSQRSIDLRLGIHAVTDAAEAQAATRRESAVTSGEVAEWQTQPPQKRPRQLMWVRLPPSPPEYGGKVTANHDATGDGLVTRH